MNLHHRSFCTSLRFFSVKINRLDLKSRLFRPYTGSKSQTVRLFLRYNKVHSFTSHTHYLRAFVYCFYIHYVFCTLGSFSHSRMYVVYAFLPSTTSICQVGFDLPTSRAVRAIIPSARSIFAQSIGSFFLLSIVRKQRPEVSIYKKLCSVLKLFFK